MAMNGSLNVICTTATGTENYADGICADGAGSEITITGLTDMVAKGQQNASAIGALSGAKVTVEGSGAINVTAAEKVGSAIYGQYENSETKVTGITDINVNVGTNGSGIISTDMGAVLVKLQGNINVVAGQSAKAIVVGDFSSANKYKKDDPSTTTVIGIGTTPSTISAQGGTFSALLFLDNGGTINVENISGTEALTNENAFAIAAGEEGGTVNMTKTALGGNVIYDASNSVAGKANNLNVNIDAASLLIGQAKVKNNDSSKDAKININNAGWWTVTDNSAVSTLENNGIVELQPISGGYANLQAAVLKGNGNYRINTDLANNTGNTITVGNGNNAVVNLQVAYDPVYKTLDWNSITGNNYQVLTMNNGSLEVNSAPTDYGAYRFTPAIVNNGNNTWNINGFKRGASESTMTAADAKAVVNELWLMDTNSLSKRLGDLRLDTAGDDGVWARFQRNNSKLKGDRLAQLNANLFQAGYDKKFSRKNGSTYWGLAVDHIDGKGSYERGGGDVKATSVALYNTWLGDSGHYYDIVLRQGHYSNDYKLIDISNNTSEADYGTNATTLSGEYGYRKHLKNGTYIEPQAEMIYGHLSGSDYTAAATGTKYQVHTDAANHFIARLGIAAGRETKHGNYYAKASYYHDFAGGGSISFDGYDYERDTANNWAELTLGGDVKLGRNCRAYGEISKYFGDVRNSLNYDIGVRWNF